MYPECRHIMTSGKKCEAPALKGGHFCYYHTRHHAIEKKEVKPTDSIGISVIEDRYTLQFVLTDVLKSLVNGTIDRHRAGLLLYGLQIASQNIDRNSGNVSSQSVKSLTRTRDGEDLAPENIRCEPAYDSCNTCPRAKFCEDYDPENTDGPDEE